MTSSVTIRPATANDQTEIRTAVMRNNLNLLGLSWQSFSVAVDTDGHFVGCGQIKSHADIEELASLVVADAWQGQGVSNLLIEVLLDRADRALWLMCESPLVGYYNKFDFAEIKDPQKLPPPFFPRCALDDRIPTRLHVLYARHLHCVYGSHPQQANGRQASEKITPTTAPITNTKFEIKVISAPVVLFSAATR